MERKKDEEGALRKCDVVRLRLSTPAPSSINSINGGPAENENRNSTGSPNL